MTDEEKELTPLDLAALRLAVDMTLHEHDDPGRIEQVQSMLDDGDHSWVEVALFCAYHQQMRSLHLKPWCDPPCWVDPEKMPPPSRNPIARDDRAAVRLTRRMIKLGISEFHPDPMTAIAEAEAQRA